MKRSLMSIVMVLLTSLTLSAQTEMIHGTVKTVEKSSATMTVATDDGAEAVLHFTDETIVHPSDKGTKDVWHGLKAGTKIAVHYTDVAARKTAVEVYDLTKTGLKATAGAVVSVDCATRKCVVKSADGVEHAFVLTARASKQVGTATAKGVATGAKVTVDYTEKAGKKTVQFFKA